MRCEISGTFFAVSDYCMKLFWRPEHKTKIVTVPSMPETDFRPTTRTIAERSLPELDALEQETLQLVQIAVAYLSATRSATSITNEHSTFGRFLEDLEQFEGRIRSLLLDSRLSKHQRERVARVSRTFQSILPMPRLPRHIQLPMHNAPSHPDLIRIELIRSIDAVVAHGKAAIATIGEPGQKNSDFCRAADVSAGLIVRESALKLAGVLEPGTFRFVRGGLIALAVAQAAFREINSDHATVLDPNVLNRFGVENSGSLSHELLRPIQR
jgi:hypothetical protein